MIFYLFIMSELLAISVDGFAYEISLFQFPLSFLIGYYCAVMPTRNNVNSIISTYFSLSEKVFYAIIFIFTWLLSFQRYKPYEIKSDKYNPNNVMLAFYRPNTFRGYMLSMFGQDVSSMSIICDGQWARFKWSEPRLIIREYYDIDNDKYVLIDTGIRTTERIKQSFYGVRNAPARTVNSLYFRFNCVRTFAPVLYELGRRWEYKWFDFIPSLFLYRRNLIK